MAKKQKRKGEATVAGSKKTSIKASTHPPDCLTIFESGWALLGSFALLLSAIWVAWNVDNGSRQQSSTRIQEVETVADLLGPIPDLDPPRVFSIQDDSLETLRQAYRKDGVVAVRGLIPTNLLGRIDSESALLIEKETSHQKKRGNQQFYVQYHGAAFLDPPVVTRDESLPKIENATAFLEVALMSEVPKMASKLMLPELQEGESVRMLRDIFLTRSADQKFACGWHVDDTGFWPATAASPGVNAWIALDDMPSVGGGGFALAVGSHAAEWRSEAQYITGATTFFPEAGYQSAADMFANRTGSGTCNIQTSAPHLHQRMEETKRIYDLKKGDVIFHQRFLFHRTVPFESEFVGTAGHDNLLYRRYSVRFSPGTAVIPPGFGTELSVLWNEDNENRTADNVSELDGPWYPTVWPSIDTGELQDLKSLVSSKMPVAEERKRRRTKEMQPFLKQAAIKQRTSALGMFMSGAFNHGGSAAPTA